MSPRLVLVLGVLLLGAGIALPLVAVSQRGAPWGFRGHRAVFIEGAGDVQVNDAEGNRKDARAGTWIEVGDELRAGRFSIARVKLPEGTLAVADSGVARITDKGVLFSSGAAEVTVPTGPGNLVVEVEGFEQALTIRPAGSDAQVRVVADGKGVAFAHVRAGSLDAGGVNAETGQVLALRRGQAPKAAPAPSAVEFTATCDGTKVQVTASAGAQVFVPGFVRVSDGSALELDAPAGASRVVVSARDVAGNVSPPQEVVCSKDAATDPKAPAPAPKAPAPKAPAPAPKAAAPKPALAPKAPLKPGAVKAAPAKP